jgi:hypothetical protein
MLPLLGLFLHALPHQYHSHEQDRLVKSYLQTVTFSKINKDKDTGVRIQKVAPCVPNEL